MSLLKERGEAAANYSATPSDTLYELAYKAALEQLKQQEGTLTSIRNRASGLLATAALVATFSTGIGSFGITSSKAAAIIPHQYGWALLATVVLIGIASSVVLWPTQMWAYGSDPSKILKDVEYDHLTARQFYQKNTRLLTDGHRRNTPKLMFRLRCYQAGTILLTAEVVTIVIAITVR